MIRESIRHRLEIGQTYITNEAKFRHDNKQICIVTAVCTICQTIFMQKHLLISWKNREQFNNATLINFSNNIYKLLQNEKKFNANTCTNNVFLLSR